MQEVGMFLVTSTNVPGKHKKAGFKCMLICQALKHERSPCKTFYNITGNRLVLQCACEGFLRLNHPANITIFTDSQYFINGWEQLSLWARSGWKRPGGRKIKNEELWRLIWEKSRPHTVKVIYEDMEKYKEINSLLLR